jgi:hypothetical protein
MLLARLGTIGAGITALVLLAVPVLIKSPTRVGPTPVIVELFTSQGCSSCPPADALLAQLAARGDVIALSFHVTYWDHQGWRDPFSNEVFTHRQGAYAHAFKLPSLYTPQMVVGGRREFVGSDRTAAADAIRDALTRPATASVSVSATAAGATITTHVHVEHATPDAVLFVAWADAERASAPNAGENDGMRLHHVDVVRSLERVPLKAGRYDGVVTLTRPEAVAGAVVAWVQRGAGSPAEPGSGDVLGAQRALVPAR